MPVSAEQIINRFKASESERQPWENTLDEAFRLFCPQRNTFYSQELVKGERRDNAVEVFDSTPQSSLLKFGSNMQSVVVPPFQDFISLAPGTNLEDPDGENAKSLQGVTKVLMANIHHSNFATQSAECLIDYAFGTGALLVSKGSGPASTLNFSAIPQSELYLEEGPDGSVGSVFRKRKVAARNILGTWPDADLSKDLKDLIEEKPEKPVDFLEATIPDRVVVNIRKKTRDQSGQVVSERVDPVELDGYRYVVINMKSKEIIVDRGMRRSPWVVFRYSVTPGEVYGRGPVMIAFADARTLNRTKELTLRNASLRAVGAYTVADDGVVNINNLRIQPGAMIPVASNGSQLQGPTIAALPSAGDFDVSQLVIAEMQRSINDILFTDPYGPIDLPVKSATELSLRQQELAKRMGSAFGRLLYEFIGPLVNICLDILEEEGLIDISEYRIDGKNLNLRVLAPIAQAQKETKFIATQRFAESLRNVFGENIMALTVNSSRYSKELAELLDINKELLNSQQEQQAMAGMLAQAAGGGPTGG